MALSVDQITAPVLIASSSTTNAAMNTNLGFLADFNKLHEQNSLSKSTAAAQGSGLLKQKSYSFLVSRQLIKRIGTSHSNSNNISLSVMNPVTTNNANSTSTTASSSSVSSNLSYYANSNFNNNNNSSQSNGPTQSMSNFNNNNSDQQNSYSSSTLKRSFIKSKTSLGEIYYNF
jgi:hypothetical protein